jgi:hypothetical protein
LELNAFEEDVTTASPHLPDGVPQNINNQSAFILEMVSCTYEIENAVKLQSQHVKHLYPYTDKDDKYVHLPNIGRDETCTEGIFLMNAALLKYLGLLTKEEKRRYNLGPNAKRGWFFLYGDASVNFHNRLYDTILRKITQLGNKTYVEMLLQVQDRILIQKG